MSPTSFERANPAKIESHSEPFHYATALENPAEGEGNGTLRLQNGGSKAEAELREREAHEKGAREGEARATAAYRAEISEARANISNLLKDFKAERDTYFRRLEPEVVQLALAIARKILHREAQ